MTPSWEMFVAPALDTAGVDIGSFVAAFVEFPVEGGHRVVLNELVRPLIKVIPLDADLIGQVVSDGTIADIEAREIAEGSGWLVCLRTGPDTCAWAFDFRRFKTRARCAARLASEHSRAARLVLNEGLLAPATELAFAAMELALLSDLLMQGTRTRQHSERLRAVQDWANHDAYPANRVAWMRDLWKRHRPAARYAEGELQITAEDLAAALEIAEEMIAEIFARLELAS